MKPAFVKEEVLIWEPPTHIGWEDILYYTVINGNHSFDHIDDNYISTSRLSNTFPVRVMATNKCGEIAYIAYWSWPGVL